MANSLTASSIVPRTLSESPNVSKVPAARTYPGPLNFPPHFVGLIDGTGALAEVAVVNHAGQYPGPLNFPGPTAFPGRGNDLSAKAA